jgi:hypothetical protein
MAILWESDEITALRGWQRLRRMVTRFIHFDEEGKGGFFQYGLAVSSVA